MIYELEITDWNSYIKTILNINNEQKYRMWYRGQADYSWNLVPSIQRVQNQGEHREQYMATNFMIQTMRLNRNAPQSYEYAKWLSLMQHYGLSTRLLDWSESPLIALYFAVSTFPNQDAAVWVLNPMKLNVEMGYGKYVPPISYGSVKWYLEGAFKDRIKYSNKIIACHGIGSDLRMYVQQSNFTVHDSCEILDQKLKNSQMCDYLYKIRISKALIESFKIELDHMGFRDSTVYPDMEHIAFEQN